MGEGTGDLVQDDRQIDHAVATGHQQPVQAADRPDLGVEAAAEAAHGLAGDGAARLERALFQADIARQHRQMVGDAMIGLRPEAAGLDTGRNDGPGRGLV